MKVSSNSRKNVLLSPIGLIWLLTANLLAGNACASDIEATDGGFCDCTASESISDDVICHIPPGNHQNMHTIRVGDPAIHSHLNHGDMLGACPGDEAEMESNEFMTQVYASCSCSDRTAGNLYHAPDTTENVKIYSLRSAFGR